MEGATHEDVALKQRMSPAWETAEAAEAEPRLRFSCLVLYLAVAVAAVSVGHR